MENCLFFKNHAGYNIKKKKISQDHLCFIKYHLQSCLTWSTGDYARGLVPCPSFSDWSQDDGCVSIWAWWHVCFSHFENFFHLPVSKNDVRDPLSHLSVEKHNLTLSSVIMSCVDKMFLGKVKLNERSYLDPAAGPPLILMPLRLFLLQYITMLLSQPLGARWKIFCLELLGLIRFFFLQGEKCRWNWWKETCTRQFSRLLSRQTVPTFSHRVESYFLFLAIHLAVLEMLVCLWGHWQREWRGHDWIRPVSFCCSSEEKLQ